MPPELRIERVTGAELEHHIPELARLRIEVFRDFPYLYDGTPEYEARYLRTYMDSPDAVVVLAFDGDRVVGASSALPLRHETEEFVQPFVDAGFDPREVFYLGESVLLRPYRGRGIGVRFFAEREAHGRALGGLRWASFCAVDRPTDHPRRPADYVPLDAFWHRRGYVKRPDLTTRYVWKDLDDMEDTAKTMTFWTKPLDTNA